MKIKYLAVLTFFNFALLQSSDQLNRHLRKAALHGQLGTVRCLVEQGADVNAKSNQDWTALALAADYGHLEIVEYLVEHRADINAKDKNGSTVLMSAAHKGHTEIVKCLAEHDADIDAKTNNEWTALMLAANEGHTEIVAYLAEHGADVNAKNNQECTALIHAADKGYVETVRCLTEHGAYMNVKNYHNRTALYRATRNAHTDVAKYLIEHGADTPTINELTALTRRKQENLNGSDSDYKKYEKIHSYLKEIAVIQQYLKDALVEQIITQEPDFAQYAHHYRQYNRQLPETRSLSEHESREQMREEEKDQEGTEFEHLIESFMDAQSAYWKNQLRATIIPLQEPQNVHPVRNFLTELHPRLLPQMISFFKSKEVFRNLIVEKLLPTATEPQRQRLEQILQAEERIASDIANRTQNHDQAEREAIAQRIRAEITDK